MTTTRTALPPPTADATPPARAAPTPLAPRLAAAGLDWIVPDWPAPAGVHALATTRNGGVSLGSHASLDLGPARPGTGSNGGDPAAIATNRARLQAFLPSAPCWLEQVHGARVVTLDAANAAAARADPPVADGAVTREPDLVLGVRMADCLPVLFAARDGSVVGAAHAGWRGLAAGVLEATLAAMALPGERVVAWLGPAISVAAFEVGPDVRDAFVAGDPGAAAAFVDHAPGKWRADLGALARRRLAAAGVTDVAGGGTCTYGDARRFFSYRRDRATGRMAALVWRAAAR